MRRKAGPRPPWQNTAVPGTHSVRTFRDNSQTQVFKNRQYIGERQALPPVIETQSQSIILFLHEPIQAERQLLTGPEFENFALMGLPRLV